MNVNDDIVAEAVTPSPTPTGPAAMNAEVHVESITLQAVKAKYIIVAGNVKRVEDVVKHDSPTLETDIPQQGPSSEPPSNEVVSINERHLRPERNVFKRKRLVENNPPSFEVGSDGWSTEDEIDDTPINRKPIDDVGGQVEVPGLMAQATVTVRPLSA